MTSGAQLVSVAVDGEGMVVEGLEKLAVRQAIRAVYLTSPLQEGELREAVQRMAAALKAR